ncbi:GNAT family N-acetyltransferase [Natronomonas halophila]|uniref:GNAT family N-acetyltransferase n=1 Tax=Natronomonas halophila TaxID=2747817 RepID=UPI0015B381CC|nr:GNAT family N-acetyltransferase [Natronomonas halophila]QLD86073.1 GNAT family N-acetyltransferase [Natronomonas halophila]
MDQSFVDGEAPAGYRLLEEVPTPSEFVRLRSEAGMAERSLEAAEQGLPNTLYSVVARTETADETDPTAGPAVGVARVIGDGGAVFQISDVAVVEAHQEQGLGTAMMDAVMSYIRAEAPETAYVNLLADVDGFYERWGFEYSAPASKGMVWSPD